MRRIRALLASTGPAVCAHRPGVRLPLSGLAVLIERTAAAPTGTGSKSVVELTMTGKVSRGDGEITGHQLRRSCCKTKLRR